MLECFDQFVVDHEVRVVDVCCVWGCEYGDERCDLVWCGEVVGWDAGGDLRVDRVCAGVGCRVECCGDVVFVELEVGGDLVG